MKKQIDTSWKSRTATLSEQEKEEIKLLIRILFKNKLIKPTKGGNHGKNRN